MMKIQVLAIVLVLLSYKELMARPADSLLNVTYGKANTYTGNQQMLTLDCFFPIKQTGKKYPMVLMMHGGGFSNGSKEAMKAHCKILADSGFIAVSINYRKGWDRGTNTLGCEGNITQLQEAVYRATQDARAALRFLVDKRDDYGIDTSWIFAGGSSAGGVLALNLAYVKQDHIAKLFPNINKDLGSLNSSSNTIKQNFTIKGICNMWGALADSTLITKENAIPTILFHGTDDIVVPFDAGRFGSYCSNYPPMFGSACIYRRTIAAGKGAVLNVATGANHGPKQFYSKITMSNAVCFFKEIMKGKVTGGKVFYDAKSGCR